MFTQQKAVAEFYIFSILNCEFAREASTGLHAFDVTDADSQRAWKTFWAYADFLEKHPHFVAILDQMNCEIEASEWGKGLRNPTPAPLLRRS